MGRLTTTKLGFLLLLSTVLCSCSNPEADLYLEAESYFNKGQFHKAIFKTTRALEVTDGGKWNSWGSTYLLRGSIWLLRARAYEAMGKLDEAIADYKAAIARGNEYTTSAVLSSDPKPGAKAEWFRTFSRYYNFLGIAYAKAGNYDEALASFKTAVAAAGGSVNRVATIDKLVGAVFGGEADKRQAFAEVVGSYCYNAGLMEEKLGRSSNAMEVARQLGYDRTLIVEMK